MLVVAAMLLLAAVTGFFTSTAGAQATCSASPTYNPSATFSTSTPTVVRGNNVVFNGTGLAPNCAATIQYNPTITVTPDASGNFTTSQPTAALALQTYTATLTQGSLVLTTQFTVVGEAVSPTTAPPVSTGSLPTTGSNTPVLVSGALGLVAVGGLLVLFARKRRGADLAA